MEPRVKRGREKLTVTQKLELFKGRSVRKDPPNGRTGIGQCMHYTRQYPMIEDPEVGMVTVGRMLLLRAGRIRRSQLKGDARNVLHHCGDPNCINVDHLYLGTDQENANDRIRDKRQHTWWTRTQYGVFLEYVFLLGYTLQEIQKDHFFYYLIYGDNDPRKKVPLTIQSLYNYKRGTQKTFKKFRAEWFRKHNLVDDWA
jgi:hypothetical protein